MIMGGQAQQVQQQQQQLQPKQQQRIITADAGEEGQGDERARTVDLAPSRKRTKGKKSLKDKMSSCSVA